MVVLGNILYMSKNYETLSGNVSHPRLQVMGRTAH